MLDAILLQAEILDLKANPDRTAEGVVIEAKLDKGRGSVATVLVQAGTLKPGDILVAGNEWGRVRALVNDHGVQVRQFPDEILEAGANAAKEIMQGLLDSYKACARIVDTPIPFPYAHMLTAVNNLFIFSLPFVLLDHFR